MAALDYLYALSKKLIIDSGDPRTKGWFLVDSPLTPSCVMLTYFLLVTRILPAFMRYRQAINLRALILSYNIVQVCANVVLSWMSVRYIISSRWSCMEVHTGDVYLNEQVPHVAWLIYMLKYADLADTFFFLLTKKERYVTGLHLYHHTTVVFATWIQVKYCPMGVLFMLCFANTLVHAAMYAYYFSALCFGNVALKWKRLITTLQLVQFVFGDIMLFIHLVNPWCSFPKGILMGYFFYTTSFAYLFARFYYKTYVCKTVEKVE